MNIKTALDNYLGKSVRFSEQDNGNGTKEVCDLDTGECYVVREKDGLIEERDIKYIPIEKLKWKPHTE